MLSSALPSRIGGVVAKKMKKMLIKKCRCGRLIPQGAAMCAECAERDKARHIAYNHAIRDQKAAIFYTSHDWRVCRAAVLAHYDNLDIYDLFINHRVTPADHVHHIVDLSDDWSLRFCSNNLIPLSHSNHSIISQFYCRDVNTKNKIQQLLRGLIVRWDAGERLPPECDGR